MKIIRVFMIYFSAVWLSACSSTPIDPSKPEVTVPDRHSAPPRTFNQFRNDWDY